MSIADLINFGDTVTAGNWEASNAYRCQILIIEEEEGGFSIAGLNLPGAFGQGETEPAAIENFKLAVSALVESYRKSGEAIPWRDPSDVEVPAEGKHKWILVNA